MSILRWPTSKMAASVALPRITSTPSEPDTIATAAKRILLIEDNDSFREVIHDYLTESSYLVVTAQNGAEGLREVTSSDFAFILCDMVMPTLSGESFYRAIERVRPELCKRFIFMTGHLGSHQTIAFIRSVDCEVLIKPFRMHALLEAIERTRETRQTQVCVPSETAALQVEVPTPVPDDVTKETASPLTSVPCAPALISPKESSVPGAGSVRAGTRRDSGAGRRAKVRLFVAGTIVLCAGIGAGLWFRAASVSERLTAAGVALEIRKQEWVAFSARLQEAEQKRLRIEELIARPARVAAARDAASWTPLLRRLMMNAAPEIGFRVIRVRGVEARPGACELHIEGYATGRAPRALAEDFRRTVETALAGQSRTATTVQFKRLEDEPPVRASVPELQRARFTISVTVQAAESPSKDRTSG